MGLYNFTNLTGTDNFLEITQYLNTVTSGWFSILFVLGIFIIGFVALKTYYTPDRCMAAASFITTTIALLLFAAGMIPNFIIIALGALTAISVVWLYASP